MPDSMIQSLTKGVKEKEDLIQKVARYLAEFDGNPYWKHNFPEGQRLHVEEWYVGNAKRYVGVVELIMEHKNDSK